MAALRYKISALMVVITAFTALPSGCVDAMNFLDNMPKPVQQQIMFHTPIYSDLASWNVLGVIVVKRELVFKQKTNGDSEVGQRIAL